jgi:hypothetical protein
MKREGCRLGTGGSAAEAGAQSSIRRRPARHRGDRLADGIELWTLSDAAPDQHIIFTDPVAQ